MSDFNLEENPSLHGGYPTVIARFGSDESVTAGIGDFFDVKNNSPIYKGVQHAKDYFGDPRFSKKALPGASHDDMAYAHGEMARHHQDEARGLHTQAIGAGTRRERNEARKQIKWHQNQADKHAQLHQHFDNLANGLTSSGAKVYKNAPVNIEPRPAPAPAPAPAPQEPAQNNAAPAPKPERAAEPAQNTAPQYSKPAAPAVPSAPLIRHNNRPMYTPSQPRAPSHQAPVIHNNAPQQDPQQQQIQPHHASMWHRFIPRIRHWFANRRPNSPMSQSHMTGSPPMPIPTPHHIMMRNQQANWHNNQAAMYKAKSRTVSSPTMRANHIRQANMHNRLALTQRQLMQKAQAASVPPVAQKVGIPKKTNKIVPKQKLAQTAPPIVKNKPVAKPPVVKPVADAMKAVPVPKNKVPNIAPKSKIRPPVDTGVPVKVKKNVPPVVNKGTKPAAKKATKPVKSGQKIINPALL